MSRVADPSHWALKLDRPDLVRAGAYIDGAWTLDGPSFPVLDPATGATLAEVRDGDAALARQATDAAVRAFPAWRDTPAKGRARLIRAWFDAVTRNADDLARLISSEQGKPVAEARARSPTAPAISTGSPSRPRGPTARPSRRRWPTGAC